MAIHIQNNFMRKMLCWLYTTVFLNFSYAQQLLPAPGKIVNNIIKDSFCLGDTLKITIKNTDSIERSYGIQAKVDLPEKDAYYLDSYYTAYFNNDSIWFKEMDQNLKVAKKNKSSFLVSNNEIKYVNVPSNGEYEFVIPIVGKPTKRGIPLKIIFITDLRSYDQDEEKIISKTVFIYAK